MVSKNGALTFDVNAQSSRPINAAIQFSTQDINTARLSFRITKDGAPLPLSAVDGKLVLSMADGSRFIRTIALVDKTEGLAEYVLTTEEIRHYGAVKAELLLRYTNGQALSIHKFGFDVDRSLIDQDIAPIAEYYIDDFEALKERVDEMYNSVVDTVRELEAKFADLENIETKTGAQVKVDTHAKRTDIHVTQSDKDKWNGGQLFRLTQNDGKPKYRGTLETTDYNEVTDSGFHLIYNVGLNGPPSFTKSFMIVISYGTTLMQTAYDEKGLRMAYRVRNQDYSWTPWQTAMTESSLVSTWNQVTLLNGSTKQFIGNPFKFSIRQNSLHLRGSFEGIPANGAVIARFTQKPSATTVFGGQTVGSNGSACFTFDADGSLKFEGFDSADNSKVTRIEINESIPLW
ncbi:BppU family phage baseplate upper protein [Bacillus pumilus]|uniref:BppU family phage baseplate upper protein n=1 Tax=Bacillus pumilus TaxID=1408 RepID=UPI0011A95D79|nr:BppU family phage baseplate upper protein [Bacillus pumilus]